MRPPMDRPTTVRHRCEMKMASEPLNDERPDEGPRPDVLGPRECTEDREGQHEEEPPGEIEEPGYGHGV